MDDSFESSPEAAMAVLFTASKAAVWGRSEDRRLHFEGTMAAYTDLLQFTRTGFFSTGRGKLSELELIRLCNGHLGELSGLAVQAILALRPDLPPIRSLADLDASYARSAIRTGRAEHWPSPGGADPWANAESNINVALRGLPDGVADLSARLRPTR